MPRVLRAKELSERFETSLRTIYRDIKTLQEAGVPIGSENGVGYECFTEGVANLGVSPQILLERVARRFVKNGGVIREDSKLQGITVIKDIGTALDLGKRREPITAHLVVDAMGCNSPITLQQRQGKKPDGICAVVGSCAAGYDPATNVLLRLVVVP